MSKLVTLLVLCAMTANAQDTVQDGGVSDAPKVIILPGDQYLFNKPAFDTVNKEMSRLQGVERAHKAEPSWATPVLIGLAVGFTAGLAVGVPVTLYLVPKK